MKNKNTQRLNDLVALHAKMYKVTKESSRQVILSVFDSIAEMMKKTDKLVLSDFGVFETRHREAYEQTNNFPQYGGKVSIIPECYRLKFTAADTLNDAAAKFFTGDTDGSKTASKKRKGR